MEPMKPMEPMAPLARWWPDELGTPASTGSQNDLRYAFFPEKHRLLVERNGKLTIYDSEGCDIGEVFQSNNGRVLAVDGLKVIHRND